MSKRTLRRAAERETRKAAYQQLRQQRAQSGSVIETSAMEPEVNATDIPKEQDLLARAQAFFHTVPETSAAQIAANRENAKLSTGPLSIEGKAIVSQNRRTHGLAGRFTVLPWENAADYQALIESAYAEHDPQSDTEQRLVDSLIKHYWLKERAIQLQEDLIAKADDPADVDAKKLALFLRYQTTHERSHYKAQRELQNLKKARRKEEIGFESQNRMQEAHEARIRLAQAKARSIEIDTTCRQVMEAPLPGNTRLSFEELAHACGSGIATAVHQKQLKKAA